jgi:hypothetical protein
MILPKTSSTPLMIPNLRVPKPPTIAIMLESIQDLQPSLGLRELDTTLR